MHTYVDVRITTIYAPHVVESYVYNVRSLRGCYTIPLTRSRSYELLVLHWHTCVASLFLFLAPRALSSKLECLSFQCCACYSCTVLTVKTSCTYMIVPLFQSLQTSVSILFLTFQMGSKARNCILLTMYRGVSNWSPCMPASH